MNISTLGDFLQHQRLQRGVTVEQVASATKISVRLLQALEEDQYVQLPAQPFVRGFVISYSRFLGLNPQEVLTQYGDFIQEKCTEDKPLNSSQTSTYVLDRKETEQSRTLLWVLMGAFVITGGVSILILKPALKNKSLSQLDQLKAVYQETGKRETGSASVATAAPSAGGAPSTDPLPPLPALRSGESPAPVAAAAPAVKPASVAAVPVKAETTGTTPTTQEKEKVAKTATPATNPPAPAAVPSPPSSEGIAKKLKSIEPERVAEPTDVLNKGDSLIAPEIQYKVVLKALDDFRVRYQVDQRPVMQFTLTKDKQLVLRATSLLRLQVSDPERVRIRLPGASYVLFSQLKTAQNVNGNPTLVLPQASSSSAAEPFPSAPVLKSLAQQQPQ